MLVILWSVFIWGYSAQNAYRTHAGEERAAAHERHRQGSECTPTRFLLDPCAPGQVAPEGDGQTAEYDLAAQNKMADWAALMVMVSTAGLFVSIFGIYFIRATLLKTAEAVEVSTASANAASDANSIARVNGEAQVRAYVTCTKCEVVRVGAATKPSAKRRTREADVATYGNRFRWGYKDADNHKS